MRQHYRGFSFRKILNLAWAVALGGLLSPAMAAKPQADVATQPTPVDAPTLERSFKRLALAPHIRAQFHTEKVLSGLDMTLKSQGRIHIARQEQRVQWTVEQPAFFEITLSPDKIQMIDGQARQSREIKASDLPNEGLAQSLSALGAIFRFDSAELLKIFKVSSLAPAGNRFTFEPRQPEQMPFRSLEAKLDSAGLLSELTVFEKSGETLLIRFSQTRLSEKP